MPRWSHFATCLVMLLALSLVGCTSASAPAISAQPAPAGSPVPQAVIARGDAPPDTLRWSIEGVNDVASLDPAQAGDSATVTVVGLIFGGLVRLSETLEVEPNDASSWDTSADGRRYTFTLRDGLKFANGDLVTASDYAYAINRAIQPETGSFGAPTQLAPIVGAAEVVSGTKTIASGIRALDRSTLQIELISPSASFLQQLTFPYTFVVQRSLVESGTNWATAPYGTGPYVVREWQRGKSIVLTANKYYWQGQPGVANLLIPFSSDSASAYQNYLAGKLDIMGSLQNPLPAALLPAVREAADFRTSPSLITRYIGFNNQMLPFDNDAVRRAFALAVDKTTIVDQVLGGEAVIANRILPPGMIGTNIPIKPLAFDPAAAQAALASAGYVGGKGFPSVTLTYSPEGENELVVRALQRDWQQYLGVTITLEPIDTNAFSKRLDTTRLTPAEGLQMYYSVWGADYPDPQNFLSLQLLTTSRYNNGNFADPNFDRLVNEADQIGARTQIQRRILLYNQAEQIAIDRVGWLPLLHAKAHLLLNPRVKGIVVTPNGFIIPNWSKVQLGA